MVGMIRREVQDGWISPQKMCQLRERRSSATSPREYIRLLYTLIYIRLCLWRPFTWLLELSAIHVSAPPKPHLTIHPERTFGLTAREP
jgi:hypothetical protein